MMKVIFLFFFVLFSLDVFSQEDLTMTAEEYMELTFGVPNEEDISFADISTRSEPPGVLYPFLKILIEIAGWAFTIVMIITAIRGAIDTNRDMEFLGRAVSTPFFFTRVAIAGVFMIPFPSGYTFLQSAILYGNHTVHSALDVPYGEVIDNYVSIQKVSGVGAPTISQATLLQVLNNLICREVSVVEAGMPENRILEVVSNQSDEDIYKQYFGANRYVKGITHYGTRDGWFGSFLFRKEDKSACGSIVAVGMAPPEGRRNGTVISEIKSKVNSSVQQLVEGIFSSIFITETIYRQNASIPGHPDFSGPSLQAIAYDFVQGDEEYKAEKLKKDFDKATLRINQRLRDLHTEKYDDAYVALEALIPRFKDEIKEQGWLMVGANFFKLLTLQAPLQPLNRVQIDVYRQDYEFLGEDMVDEITSFTARASQILGGAENGGNRETSDISKFDTSVLLGEDENINDISASYCFSATFDKLCLGSAYIEKALYFSKSLATDWGVHPLYLFHSYGLNGWDDAWRGMVMMTVINTGVKFVGYSFVSSKWFWLQAFGNVIVDGANRTYSAFIAVIVFMGGVFLIMSVLPLFPLINWIIVTVDWAVTIMIMIFVAPIFAVFHALPDGHGFTSDYAQRGYPALLGGIFMSFFMLVGMFVFVVISSAALKIFGASFYLAISFYVNFTTVDLFIAILIWVVMLLTALMIMNHSISLVVNFPDRALNVLGVYGGLISGANASQLYDQSKDFAKNQAGRAQELVRPVNDNSNLRADSNTSSSGSSKPPQPPNDSRGGNNNTTPSDSRASASGENNQDELIDPHNEKPTGGSKGDSSSGASYSQKYQHGDIDDQGRVAVDTTEAGKKQDTSESSVDKSETPKEKTTGVLDRAKKAAGKVGKHMKYGAFGTMGGGSNVQGAAADKGPRVNVPESYHPHPEKEPQPEDLSEQAKPEKKNPNQDLKVEDTRKDSDVKANEERDDLDR